MILDSSRSSAERVRMLDTLSRQQLEARQESKSHLFHEGNGHRLNMRMLSLVRLALRACPRLLQ